MSVRLTVATVVALTLSACKNCEYLGWHPIITSPSGQKLCAAHHVPLVTQRGYQQPGVFLVHYHGKSYIADYCNPNHIEPMQSLQPKRGYTNRADVTYCPICEARFQKHWSSPDREQPASKLEQWRAGVKLTDR
jgi:RNA polymerase subunit RPABC4/transcription elongation factor Spt4